MKPRHDRSNPRPSRRAFLAGTAAAGALTWVPVFRVTLPVTAGFSQFYADMESWIWSHYTGRYATVRPEWSKAWACTPSGPWTSAPVLASTIPAAVSAGQASGDGWPAAVSILTGYDPGAVFSNPFLDTLLG